MVVGLLVVAESHAHDARLGIADNPYRGQNVGGTWLRGLTGNGPQHFDTFRTGQLHIVTLVIDDERTGHALHDGVVGLRRRELEVAVAVATRSACDETVVVGRHVAPVIPDAGMQDDNALTRIGKVRQGLLEFR